MARRPYAASRESVFIRHDGSTMEIRLHDDTTRAVCKAARDLNARYFVAIDGWSMVTNCPVWGVFDMNRAQENNPIPGEWAIEDPIKTFPIEAKDAAVVYAVMLLGRR